MIFDCDPVAVIERQLEAYRALDAQAFAAFYAPDAILYDHPDTVVMSGRAEIEAMYAQSFAQSPNTTVTITSRIVSGRYVIDQETLKDGPLEAEATLIYRFNADCQIDRVDFLPLQMVSE
ncbi:MAG: SgcJ/EcaC family oxidoreductase [Brevundimonas sp.]|uniref:nuclear transport factor 2 family protein n=1 Tax=Brevundimonas sp. TaxID=1871086 RepID=UPI0027534904|nr:SgcJ/EcaC family oxidoreductase [Brevundimonas sp.]MDP3401234.1 SgcJ/EcaC family oxidoreductase [Brevundimonas sp.]MDZ4108157.1 SgcJ/EcaC family oxidoreductase [Brevundimonas sp.]